MVEDRIAKGRFRTYEGLVTRAGSDDAGDLIVALRAELKKAKLKKVELEEPLRGWEAADGTKASTAGDLSRVPRPRH